MELSNEELELLNFYTLDDKNEIIDKLNSDDTKIKNNVLNFLKGYFEFKHKNYKDALKYFQESDDEYYLSLMYLYGLGCKPKEKKAFKMLRDNLDDKVNIHLALMLFYGYGCNKDVEKAYNLVIDEANNNDLKSMLLVYKYYEYNHDQKNMDEMIKKIENSNDFSIDFATYFNEIYINILLKGDCFEKVKSLVENAIENDDIATYEKVVDYYFDNGKYKEILDVYQKKVKPSRETRSKIKNARRLYKAMKLDPNVISLQQAKTTLRMYHFKMFYLGCGFGTYLAFILLYFLYVIFYQAKVENYYPYLILSMLFNLSSICLGFFATRIEIKEKYNAGALVVIFNEISSLILITINIIITYCNTRLLIHNTNIPIIAMIIVHVVFTILGLFAYVRTKNTKKEIENN